MIKSELMNLVGENVHIYFKDGGGIFGTLKYADEFSEKHGFRKVDYFYIGHTSFKVSHVKSVKRVFDIRHLGGAEE